MCEIDITDFVRLCEPFDFSASMAERGATAGPDTWLNAMKEAGETPLLKTEQELDAMRQWMKDSGGWDETERAAYSPQDLNALFIQLISGDMCEAGFDECDLDEFDWDAYREQSEQGQVSGNLYLSDDGRVYFYLGS